MATIAASSHAHAGPYPVTLTIDGPLDGRNRLTTFFRPLLAIPHALLVGPVLAGRHMAAVGFLGAAAYVLALVNWGLILLNKEEHLGIRKFQLYYLRWRTRAMAYMALFVDPYPPFDDVPYPAAIEVGELTAPRDRLTVAFRPLLALPHIILLTFLMFAWGVTTLLAWAAIVFTGRFPASLRQFGMSVMGWLLRVEAYLLLLVDEYPGFEL
jgi:hypothetical protein